MISRLGLSAVLATALIASLSLKVPGNREVVSGTRSHIQAETVALLHQQGFEVTEGHLGDTPTWVSAAAGSCQMLIAEVAPQGWHRSLVTQLAMGHRLLYIFSGDVYSEQPVIQTRAYYYWRKLHHYLRLEIPDRPVLAVIATPACATVPLNDLASLTSRVGRGPRWSADQPENPGPASSPQAGS